MIPYKTAESIGKSLQHLIDKHNLSGKLTVSQIKAWVYNEEGEAAFRKFNENYLYFFSDVSDINEINAIIQMFSDAWNYFPHKILGGKSPVQVMNEKRK